MKTTESQNPRSSGIDTRSALEIAQIMNDEDAQIAAAVRQVLPQIASAIDGAAARLRSGGRLLYAGAGTSGRMAVIDAVELVPTFSIPPELAVALMAGGESAFVRSIEGAEDHAELGASDVMRVGINEKDVLIGVAASGRTPYVIGALENGNAVGALTIAVCCNVPAPILEIAQIPIGVVVGAEVIAGSTRLKSGTAQKMILNMISTGTMIRLGKVYDNLMVDVRASNEKLVDRAVRIVAQIAGIPQDEARYLLEQCDFEVKTAIVMAKRGADAPQARALLHESDGFLRRVIG